jgi:hypothetical protein
MLQEDRRFAEANILVEAYNLMSSEYSPRPRGENLLCQLYTCDGPQHRIQHTKPGLPTDSHQRHRWKREKEETYTQQLKQSLSDYTQQD